MDDNSFGEMMGQAIKDLRNNPDLKWSRLDLARRSGIAEIVLEPMERGQVKKKEYWEIIASTFEVTYDEFVEEAYELHLTREFHYWKHTISGITSRESQRVWQAFRRQMHAFRPKEGEKEANLRQQFQEIYDKLDPK